MTMEATQSEDGDGANRLLLERQICFRLYVASNLVTRLYRQHLDAMGLTYPQYLVLLILWETEPQSVGQLGTRLYLDSGTLTPLLKRLEGAGLVVRKRDTIDERRVLIALTPAGHAMRDRADIMLEALEAETCLLPDDIDGLGKQLDGFISDLGEQLGTAGRAAAIPLVD